MLLRLAIVDVSVITDPLLLLVLLLRRTLRHASLLLLLLLLLGFFLGLSDLSCVNNSVSLSFVSVFNELKVHSFLLLEESHDNSSIYNGAPGLIVKVGVQLFDSLLFDSFNLSRFF